MLKSIPSIAALLFLCGCSWSAEPSTTSTPPLPSSVNVILDDQGNLHTGGWNLSKEDLPGFAKQVGNTPVVITCTQGAPFSKALIVQKEMNYTGVTDVRIGDIGR
jgi:hypothetical protein